MNWKKHKNAMWALSKMMLYGLTLKIQTIAFKFINLLFCFLTIISINRVAYVKFKVCIFVLNGNNIVLNFIWGVQNVSFFFRCIKCFMSQRIISLLLKLIWWARQNELFLKHHCRDSKISSCSFQSHQPLLPIPLECPKLTFLKCFSVF